ncbi:hypothetical protein EJ066_14600 [Mesorhizobium sp. M9A.F.Ca.ET.002.03.1.2]|uniref:hypothetical protein n=1 Tax=Mesorhizobium sp. M9A.F.Ca.ET.002.03.1.2 TaxID=2493668 RepID=UPI000F763D07|nr:hypothetical protein [Mesorhizobium sp. M9A.F.Ca.ET.002.03.1.2]AZN98301.1 hypothetical protein EJ066_14600 [Mesorhizobium sp. M9A.F.Ca.ET.002.03.1.2]
MLQAASLLHGAGESLLHLSGPSASIRKHQPRSCGLVLLGYPPKPYGSRELFERRTISVHCSCELVVGDEEIADTPFASRCFYIQHPFN